MAPPDHAGAVGEREPDRQQVEHAGEEARLAGSEQEPQDEEHRGVLGIGERERHRPPADHDASEPAPRPDPLEDDVARHLEQEVADEEQRGAEPVGVLGQPEIAHHLQLGVADVLPIDVGDQVDDADEGQQVPRDLANGGGTVVQLVDRGHGRELPGKFW